MASRGVDGLPYNQMLKVNFDLEYWPMGILVTIETKACMQYCMVYVCNWVGRALGIDQVNFALALCCCITSVCPHALGVVFVQPSRVTDHYSAQQSEPRHGSAQ